MLRSDLSKDARPERAEARKRRKVGLVVVHGVGETEPGSCLNSLVDKLETCTAPGNEPVYEFADYNDYERVIEKRPGKKDATFPVFRREGEHANGTKISAVELYWADTTMLGSGRVNTLLAFFRVIFKSQHLVYAMLDRGRDVASAAASHILLIAAWMLRGPIAALTVATSALCYVLLFEPESLKFSLFGIGNAQWKFLIVQTLLMAGSVAFFVRIVRRQELAWYDLVFWVFAFTVLLILLDASGLLFPLLNYVPSLRTKDLPFLSWLPFAPVQPAEWVEINCVAPGAMRTSAENCYISQLYKVIIWLWRGWGVLLLVCVAILAAARLIANRRSDRAIVSAIATSIGILILQFLLWTTVVVSTLYPMLNRAESNAAIAKLVQVPQVRTLEAQFKTGNDLFNAGVIELFHLTDIHPDWIFRFKFIYVAATFTLMMFFTGAWLIMRMRRRWGRSGIEGLEGEKLERRLQQNARRMPKLLFNQKLVYWLIAAYLMVMLLIYWQSLFEFNQGFVNFRSIFLPIAAVIAVIVPMVFGPWITNIVHIARDLIDHHYRPRLETGSIFLPKYFHAPEGLPRRERIQKRLLQVLNRFIKDSGFDEVIFVTHSQGSIVVYDYLRQSAGAYPELGEAVPSFISCGSPLGTIYQTYFYEYGHGNTAAGSPFLKLKRWDNIYRVDDYIGGPAAKPEGVDFDNTVLPAGENRHMYYWTEDAVAAAIDAMIRDAPRPSAATAARPSKTSPDAGLPPPPASMQDWVHAMRGA